MCDLCIRSKKIFTHEHQLFTQAELRTHERRGDDNPGAVDQSGFGGHPDCGFCRERFYGDDELYAHCREKHERCHLCDRRHGGSNPQYYVDYNALESHFNKDHWPCLDQECQEKKFVVFDSELDLKVHQLDQHPNDLSKDARRDARRVDISAFDYRPQYQETRRGGRRGGRGRGRDPNAEGMPATSASHMSRAEVAHQRQREIQTAQGAGARTFGGSLTRAEPATQTINRVGMSQSPRLNNVEPASVAERPRETLNPAEQARRIRHDAIIERASMLLNHDANKLSEFRARISAYRNATMSASELIEAFFSLFDTTSSALGTLIKELAEIFEGPTAPAKRDALLKAWSDWKAINEDYPSLPGPTSAHNASTRTAAGVAAGGPSSTSRVLKLKSSTAQSGRSQVGQQQQRSWGTAAGGASASSSSTLRNLAFPSLSVSSSSSTPAATWLAVRQTNSSLNGGSQGTPVSRAVTAPPPASETRPNASHNPSGDAFPALPAAKKPTSAMFSPGYKGPGVLRVHGAAATGPGPWGAGRGVGSATNGTADGGEGESSGGTSTGAGKGKGRKGKQQVLFKWGG